MGRLRSASPPGERFGALAEFATPEALQRACRGVRDAGYEHWDAHAPFPLDGLADVIGLPPSRLPRIALVLALVGAAAGTTLPGWVSAIAFPLVVSGKSHFGWPALVPVAFALALLGAALGAVFGLLALGRLPALYHPLFGSTRFERATDDGFFISIESRDPKYDADQTVDLLRRLGAAHVELVAS
jgi:hypothetical protein